MGSASAASSPVSGKIVATVVGCRSCSCKLAIGGKPCRVMCARQSRRMQHPTCMCLFPCRDWAANGGKHYSYVHSSDSEKLLGRGQKGLRAGSRCEPTLWRRMPVVGIWNDEAVECCSPALWRTMPVDACSEPDLCKGDVRRPQHGWQMIPTLVLLLRHGPGTKEGTRARQALIVAHWIHSWHAQQVLSGNI